MNREQTAIVKAALDEEETLTDWEWDFINHMAELEDIELSVKQSNELNRICNKLEDRY